MGREIRRVPKGWEHPKYDHCPHYPKCDGDCFKPMFDKSYDEAAQEWIVNFEKWQRGEYPDQPTSDECKYYWDWSRMPPDQEYYRPAWTEVATHYQIYETVSEGTPISPVFETLDEMRDWLIQKGYSKKSVDAFIKSGWVPSMVYSPGTGLVMGIDSAGLLDDGQP